MGTEVLATTDQSGKDITDLEQKIIRQVEYYFGNFNLCKDKFLREQITLDDGWVPLETLVKFNRLKCLSEDFGTICAALGKSPNGLVEVNEDSTKIRRRTEKPVPDKSSTDDVDDRTLYMKGFRKNVTLDELLDFFKEHKVEHVFMRRRFLGNGKVFKGSCFVLFETLEDAVKFLDTKGIKFENTELLKEKKKDYVKRKDIYYQNLRAEKEKKLQKKSTEDKKESGTEATPQADITPGCLLKVTGLNVGNSREDLRAALEKFGNISYIDYFRGNPEGVVRFETAVAASVLDEAEEEDGAKKFMFGACKATVSVVEGDSEKEYWKSIAVSKANMRQKNHQNQRQGKGRFNKNWGKRRGNHKDGNRQPPSKKLRTDGNEEKTESKDSNGQDKGAVVEKGEADKPAIEAEC